MGSTAMPSGMRLGLIEPTAAVAQFQQRKLLQPSFAWQDIWQAEHAKAFAVAGVMKLDVLATVQAAVGEALAKGQTLEQFSKALQPKLAAAGFWGNVKVTDPETGEIRTTKFNANRLATIFQTNIRQSHAAANWQAIERNQRFFPFVRYETMDDAFVRAAHKPWHGITLPVGHAWWQTHYPPNGWRCRCKARALNERQLRQLQEQGLPVKQEAPPLQLVKFLNTRTGETASVPRGIDPGFGYNPGMQRAAGVVQQQLSKAIASPAPLASEVLHQSLAPLLALPDTTPALQQAWQRWQQELLANPQADVQSIPVGYLLPAAIKALQQLGREPASAVIVVTRKSYTHGLRASKQGKGIAADQALVDRLPEAIASPQAVLVERATGTLLYVLDAPNADGKITKMVVSVDYELVERSVVDGERKKVRRAANLVKTMTLGDVLALRDRTRYALVSGSV